MSQSWFKKFMELATFTEELLQGKHAPHVLANLPPKVHRKMMAAAAVARVLFLKAEVVLGEGEKF